MRIKGISWIEQHFEKIIAAVFGTAMLGVLAWQFAGPQASVKVGSKDVPINQAIDEVALAAKLARGKLETIDAPKVEGLEGIMNPLAEAERALRGPVAPSPQLDEALGVGTPIDGGAVVRGAGPAGTAAAVQFAGLKAPAPSRPVAQSHGSSISPLDAKVPEIAAVLPKALPFDKFSVTAEFVFSGTGLRDALSADPDGDGPMVAMPKSLWESGIQIVQTEVERQELGADGQWAAATPVKPIPGRFNLVDRVSQPMNGVAALKEVTKVATDRSGEIRRPAYYRVLQGPDWKPPTERVVVDDADKKREIANLRRQYKEHEKRKVEAQEELEKVPPAPAPGGKPDPAPSAPAPPTGGGGRGTGGGAGGGAGRGPAPRAPGGPAPSNPAQDATKRKNLERKIDAEMKAMERVIGRLVVLGDDTKDLVAVDPNAPVTTDNPLKKTDGPLLDDAAVRLWVHDVYAERGKTYRYRARVVLSNPVFMQFTQLAESQAELAKSPVFRSEFSEWSDPVAVEDQQYFFVTGANVPDTVDRTAGARVEMYTFSWGYWRRANARLEPGDRVQGIARGTPDFSAIAKQIMDGAPSPNDPNAPGGGGRAPGGPDGQGDAKPNVPVVDLPVTIDAALLNVGTDPSDSTAGAGRGRLFAFFRDAAGRVVIRVPENDPVSQTLRALRSSAEEGLLALKPKAQSPDGGATPPPDDGGGRDAPPIGTGGGGKGTSGGG